MDRFGATTEHLRDTACRLLEQHGARAFSQEALAESAYVSIGTVYQRWSSKWDTLADLAAFRLKPAIAATSAALVSSSNEQRCVRLFDTAEGRRLLILAAETLLAAREHGELRRPAIDIVNALSHLLGSDDFGSQWWPTTAAIGWGMMLGGGIPLVPIGAALSAALHAADPTACRTISAVTDLGPVVPSTPVPIATDDAGSRLKSATRRLLADPARSNLTTRDLTSESGVTTGTMYRRFPSRTELLRAVLIDEVQSERYAWSSDMVTAMTGDQPLAAVNEIILAHLARVFDDRHKAALILEITVTARGEPQLRDQLVGQITAAVDARESLFQRLQAAGVLSTVPNATQLSWLFQAPPIGCRLLGALGMRPTDEELRSGLNRIIRSLVPV